MNRDATTTCSQTNTAASAADPNALASTLNEMAYNVKHSGNNEDRIRNTSVKTGSSTIGIGREKLKFLSQSEEKLAVETAIHEDIRGFIEDIIGDIFITGYYASKDGTKILSLSFVQDTIANMIYREILDETLDINFRCWSCSDTLMKALVGSIGKNQAL